METIELWPLSQGEIDRQPEGLVDQLFARGSQVHHTSSDTRAGYVGRIIRGGFPEAVTREPKRRRRLHRAYVADMVNRDVTQLSSIKKAHELRTLLSILAAREGQILKAERVAQELTVSASTVARYLGLVEEAFLAKRLPAWSRSIKTRATQAPKTMFVDSGIAATLLGEDNRTLARLDGQLGPLLEGFVASEIARQCSWSEQETMMSHYRTRDQVEVDLILERSRRVVAIEVKASSTVRAQDFRGLMHLASRLGDDLVVGVVLYLGEQTLPFGERLRAIPVAALWEHPAGPPIGAIS
jgi:predicted AAA+ superfamily ATPase